MFESPEQPLTASTPASVEASVQTQEPAAPTASHERAVGSTYEDKKEGFDIGDGVTRAMEGRPYERQPGHPLYRPLKIFALDPSVSRLEGATALVNVPYEPLEAGPEGKIFKIVPEPVPVNTDGEPARPVEPYVPLDLEDESILINNGLDPSTSDRHFHEQMVYAVCSIVYTAFRIALGRHITWGFDKQNDRLQLLIRPRVSGINSYYDKKAGELCFGYYKSKAKGEFAATVYACLSHDTVAHEVTHALLDGLRAHFSRPTSSDVLAFHEGFADLVAVFQHFSYEQVVRTAIRNSHGVLSRAELLTDIAKQLGQTGREYKTALRSAIDFAEAQSANEPGKPKSPKLYDSTLEHHDLGSILVIAVFEAFITVFRRKTERLVRLATNGSGRLPPGDLPADLQAALAEKASRLASQFLTMCIRAIDYCPPVDITFGEYLRAVITADRDLVPDDPWAYREAWIDAFRRHRIYPSHVDDLSEDSLLWRAPERLIPPTRFRPIRGLAFRKLKFSGDPAWPADEKELRRQATVFGNVVAKPENRRVFGLAIKGEDDLRGDHVELPKIQSIRSSRRIGPSGQIVFDIIAEVTQKRMAQFGEGSAKEICAFYGGSTVIIDPDGRIRYVVRKPVTDNKRLADQKKFLDSPAGAKHKPGICDTQELNLFKMLHDEDSKTESGPSLPFFF